MASVQASPRGRTGVEADHAEPQHTEPETNAMPYAGPPSSFVVGTAATATGVPSTVGRNRRHPAVHRLGGDGGEVVTAGAGLAAVDPPAGRGTSAPSSRTAREADGRRAPSRGGPA